MEKNEKEIILVLTSGAEQIEADKHVDKPLSAVFAIDVATNPETQEPIYTSRVVWFVSNYARARASLNMAQALHDTLLNSDGPSNARMEYEKLVALMPSGRDRFVGQILHCREVSDAGSKPVIAGSNARD